MHSTAITWADCHVHVLGAALLPLNFGDQTHSWKARRFFYTRASLKDGGRIERSCRKVTGTK